jgi:RNA polymerase sigma-70 factor (ECF subfamily)
MVADGDGDALQVLYDRHLPWLVLRLGRRCSDENLVDDAVQETFLAIWRGAARFRGDGAVSSWIWGIAVRRLIDLTRRRPTHAWVGEVDRLEPSAEELVLLGIEYGDLAAVLGRLSPELRAVIRATALDGLSNREAATLLGIPTGTVKTRLMRARRQLRAALT